MWNVCQNDGEPSGDDSSKKYHYYLCKICKKRWGCMKEYGAPNVMFLLTLVFDLWDLA